MKRRCAGLILVLTITILTGCATHLRNQVLEAVAKDWSLVVRASQVIPVYPLTEDLQPGDILLVQIPIEQQQEIYKQRGFLPLDNLIRRVNPTQYQAFYQRSFGVGQDGTFVPRIWMMPATPGTAPWSLAPTASFPTYSFAVKSGGGFNLAFPVQGVPVGLSLLGGDAAQGTITIADARTYGIDTLSLYEDVRKWAEDRGEFLSHYAPSDKRRNYLRVVSRVYLAGRLNVSLQSSGSSSASGSGGAPKPVDLITQSGGTDAEKETISSYETNVQRLNKMIEDSLKKVTVDGIERFLPGGTLKVAAASAHSVTLVETFSRPLVIGYLGFDMEIGPEGILGPPIPTHALLMNQITASEASPTLMLLSTASVRHAYTILKERQKQGDGQAAELIKQLDQLERLVPQQYSSNIFGLSDAGAPLSVDHKAGEPVLPKLRGNGFPVVTTYKGQLLDSIENLRAAQTDKSQKFEGRERTADTEAYLRQQLAENEQARRELDAALQQHKQLLKRAQDYANQSN
jgi:hypothetical protein